MSKQREQDILSWRKLECDLRTRSLYRDGQRLDAADTRSCAQAYTLYGLLLVDLDLADSHSSRRVIRRLAQLDVLTVVSSLKSCDQLLLKHVSAAAVTVDFECFKHTLEAIKPLQYILLDKVSDLLDGASIEVFRCLHQAFSFLSRLTLDGVSIEPDIQAWIENNERIGNYDIDFSIVDGCRPIVTEWLTGISIPYVGKHGSGTVADWTGGRKICLADKVNDPTGKLYHGYSPKMVEALRTAGIDDPSQYFAPDFHVNYLHELDRAMSKLIAVPKNALKRRIIAPESLTQQYFQQQIMVGLYRHISTRLHFIPLRDQGVNRELARQGSISGYFATVDLSAASDSVSTQLVKRMFRDTSILPAMEACRSRATIVERDGTKDIVSMNMYATMGSAICFPLECIVFAAICEYTARSVGRTLRYSVYGDDIIFPSKYVDALTCNLRKCGFVVNDDKSFMTADPLLFRESCGGEYLRGYDVTPLRISRRLRPLENKRKQPAIFAAYVDMANSCLDKGFLEMRSYLIRQLFQHRPYPIFGEGEGQLHPIGPATNFRLRHRWNKQLQREEYLAAVVREKDGPAVWSEAIERRQNTGLYGECELWNWHRERALSDWLSNQPITDYERGEHRSAPSRLRTKVEWISALS